MDWTPINWGLIKHPMNWIVILLMVFIGGATIHYILQWQTGGNPPASK